MIEGLEGYRAVAELQRLPVRWTWSSNGNAIFSMKRQVFLLFQQIARRTENLTGQYLVSVLHGER